MFVVLFKFSVNKPNAARFMAGHNAWLNRGLDDGVFVLAGSLQPNAGGAILAQGVSLAELESRVAEDPFVAENVVAVEILEISPSRADDRLAFLKA